MKYRGIFEYEYPIEHKPPISIDVHLHGDCVKGKIIEWEYRPLEQEPTTKNDLGVELISKEQTIDRVLTYFNHIDKGCDDEWAKGYEAGAEDAIAVIKSMPSVTPQEPQTFKWCTDCKEYDQEKHCCHRWSRVIRDTVEEVKQEQEPILDKIRAEIERGKIGLDIEFNGGIDYALSIIDKYKAESEE